MENREEFLETIKKQNPIGTKFLVEIEVITENGYNEFGSSMFNKEKLKEFELKHGCSINKIYRKDAEVVNLENTTAVDLLNIVLDKVKRAGI